MDLAQVISALNQNTAETEQTKAGMKSAYGAAIGATGEAASAITRAGEANAIIKSQEEKGLLEAQNQSRRMATANGTNLSSENEILTILGQQQRQQALEVSERAKRVDAIAQAANLGNPFGLLFDIFYGDGERRALESGRAQLEATTQSIQSLNQATQTTALTQKTIAETKSDATLAATEELALAKAAEAVADRKIQMASLNVDMLKSVNSLSQQQLNNVFKQWQAEESAEHRAFIRMQKEAVLKAKMAEEASFDEIINYHNEGIKVLGGAPIANRQQFETFRKMGKDVQARMDLAIQKGFELTQTGKLSFGNTPMEALSLKQAYNVQVPPIQQPVFNYLDQWVQELEADPGNVLVSLGLESSPLQADAAYKKAKPAEKEEIRNLAIQRRFIQEANNLSLDNPSGLLALPPIDSLQGQAILDENPFLSKYVKPSVEAGGGIAFNPGKFIQMAEKDIISGELSTSDVASGLEAMSKELFAQGILAKGLTSAFGLPELREYPVTVTTSSVETKGFSPTANASPFSPVQYVPRPLQVSRKVDILDPAAWNNYLNEYLRRVYTSNALGAVRNGQQ